ncbi:hypothetical protein RD792_017679 [Penstemon davidsonii]|uniref:Disease resistance R13L4/SHOC-2-like LRR domain-containing protein n=1 Tax=Penstemon davidsonii TaxID=160366 RepID=A0ABR0DWU4_9LAMI|nr:hypothetical protein RD792_017679 [Penstemon davidsonii]
MWEGVVCNNWTGHVLQLHLQNDTESGGLQGELNPSLLNLKHLRYIDLSRNNFTEPIPNFIGSFRNLEYLDLSNAGFYGNIPHTLGNLSSLRTLSLAWLMDCNVDNNIEWLSGLSHLEQLNMNSVNLSKATNWVQVMNKLPSLVELNLGGCSLQHNSMALLDEVNFTSLAILDLSRNQFESVVPRWIFQLNNLTYLDLSLNSFKGLFNSSISNSTTKLQYINISFNNFNSTIPEWIYTCKRLKYLSIQYCGLHGSILNVVGNLTSLIELHLEGNMLSGKIPSEITKLCKMRILELYENNFQGEISGTFGNMSNCFLGSLETLNLRRNQLSGHLTDQFGDFKRLQTLDLYKNLLSGPLPPMINLGLLSSLTHLCLGFNKFTGNIPESFGQLYNLKALSVENNMMEGIVSESHFANLTNLSYLTASGNHLTLEVEPNWIPPFKLYVLQLGSWNLCSSQIPTWIETQKNYIFDLDLSDTGISFNVPNWFWEIFSLNLSRNQLHGNIPIDLIFGPKVIDLSSNRFNGSLPRVAYSVIELDLSNNSFSEGISHFLCDTTGDQTYQLSILHLGGNLLSGELPANDVCWMTWSSLQYLNIGSNNMSGSIPDSIGLLENLESLNMDNNSLSGQIPSSIQSCKNLIKIDLSDNKLVGSLASSLMGIISLSKLRFLITRSNKLSGEIPSEICQLNLLQVLDLSNNIISGNVPKCVDNFTTMATKIWSADYPAKVIDYSNFIRRNFFESASIATKGSELHYDSTLYLVTNIDLSRNNMSGEIPKQINSLAELRSLNLSENHFTGLIPDGIGHMKQLESLDLSRNSLSGEIPNNITALSSLNYMNLSYNNLIGRIPESTQLQSLNASSFIGNKLCGPPLKNGCSNDHAPRYKEKDDDDGGKTWEIDWFYIFLTLGYVVGFSVVCNTLIFNKSWRDAYFEWLENMWNKLCVYTNRKWFGSG